MILFLLMSLVGPQASAGGCDTLTGCQARICQLQAEIAEADRLGHKIRAGDLRETLARNQSACDPRPDNRAQDAAYQVKYREMEVQDQKNFGNETKAAIKQLILEDEKMELEQLQKKK